MENKFIDRDGLKVLWNQVNLKDYPNNETLMAVIDAIDETKSDKNHTHIIGDIEELEETINDIIDVVENDNTLNIQYNANRLRLLFDEENYEILNGKILNLVTYEYMVSASDVKNRPAFLFNIEENLSDYNNFDYYFVQIKLPIDGKNYYSNGYAKFNKGSKTTFMCPFGGNDYIQLMITQKVEKIYESANSNSLIDAPGKCCVKIEPYHYYSTAEEAEILAEIIRNAEITIYCGRLNNLALDNTIEYVPTSDYHPATKLYVDSSITISTEIDEAELNTMLEEVFV